MKYTNGGFGVLIARDTLQVLIWKDLSVPMVSTRANGVKVMKTVKDFDKELAKQLVNTNEGVFTYTDANNEAWIVAACPLFQSGHIGNPKISSNKLVILVFAQSRSALKSLASLNANIKEATNTIIEETSIITAAIVASTLFLVLLMVRYMTQPLDEMLQMSEELQEISANGDDVTDYNSVLNRAHGNSTRTDEIGILAREYYNVVQLLNDRQRGQEIRQNPFHIPPSSWGDPSKLTWTEFIVHIDALFNDAEPPVASSFPAVQDAPPLEDGADFISLLLSPVRSRNVQIPQPEEGETENFVTPVGNSVLVEERTQVGWFTSLKFQLYFLSGILLSGVIVIMVVTAVSLGDVGDKWSRESKEPIDNDQITNMHALTYSKSAFVMVTC